MTQSHGSTVEVGNGLMAWVGRPSAALSLADDPLPLVLAGAVVTIIGAAVVVRARAKDSSTGPDNRSSGDPTGSEVRERSAQVSFEERIGETTLDRLAPILPDAVGRVRDLESDGCDDRETERERINRAERELRRGLKDALADGRLDTGLTGPDDEPYEIVNLPSRYREFTVPPSGRTVHVGEAERAVRDQLEDGTLRDAAIAAAAVDDHREKIRQYVQDREEEIVDLRNEIDATLVDVRDLSGRLDGKLADRVEEFVLDGRHDDVDGVAEIERDISDAMHSLHRCSFEDARRELRTAREAAADLLVTVDFLGGLVGTVEHGSGTVEVPTVVSTALVTDLAPIIERQYDVDASVDGTAIAITERNMPGDEDDVSRISDVATPATEQTPAGESTGGSTGTRNHVATESVADEILFVLRELGGNADGDTVQCQTERLPKGIAQPAVLEELAAFCRRQTDVVATVDLQEGAPPGFLEIEFTDRTTVRGGLETLRERFVERHGG
ncbi:hypothetical protein [Natrinema sp. SYSU A 869]|uniref:hypothetical protein n=1 Tax=Natrinema sp. SYSU A 869 TaxID=2871694 RepID=UPI001CA441D5|nr:hypothetical protein [Natrinema sp. SYSU A 869]